MKNRNPLKRSRYTYKIGNHQNDALKPLESLNYRLHRGVIYFLQRVGNQAVKHLADGLITPEFIRSAIVISDARSRKRWIGELLNYGVLADMGNGCYQLVHFRADHNLTRDEQNRAWMRGNEPAIKQPLQVSRQSPRPSEIPDIPDFSREYKNEVSDQEQVVHGDAQIAHKPFAPAVAVEAKMLVTPTVVSEGLVNADIDIDLSAYGEFGAALARIKAKALAREPQSTAAPSEDGPIALIATAPIPPPSVESRLMLTPRVTHRDKPIGPVDSATCLSLTRHALDQHGLTDYGIRPESIMRMGADIGILNVACEKFISAKHRAKRQNYGAYFNGIVANTIREFQRI